MSGGVGAAAQLREGGRTKHQIAAASCSVSLGACTRRGLVGEHILVEVDGCRYHSASVLGGTETAESFVRERFTANVAQRLGYLALRYSDADIDVHLVDAVGQVEAIVRGWRQGIVQYREAVRPG